jgi:SCY1-like protein 2
VTRNSYPQVCIWLLDKRELSNLELAEKKGSADRLLEVYRKDAQQLLRLRHPGIVRVIEPLEETKFAMAMVTEPVYCSLANVLKQFDNMKEVPEELRSLVGRIKLLF